MPVAWVIGVAESCDLRVDSPYVSGRHCRLERVAEGWVLEDLGSTNGTYVNRRLIGAPEILADGDEVQVGKFRLVFIA